MGAATIAKHVQEEMRRRLSYDKDTGAVIWVVGRKAGQQIFNKSCQGYLRLKIAGKNYYLHRVCWFLHHGEWPTEWIDHINGNKSDNRLENLRVVSSSQNSANRPLAVNNTTGYKGVVYRKAFNKYLVRVGANPRTIVGYFESLEEAARAYNEAAKELYGEYARLNNIQGTQEQ